MEADLGFNLRSEWSCLIYYLLGGSVCEQCLFQGIR